MGLAFFLNRFSGLLLRLFGFAMFLAFAIILFVISGQFDTEHADFLGIYPFTAVSTDKSISTDDDGNDEITYYLCYITEDGRYSFSESITERDYDRFNSDSAYRPTAKRSVWTCGDGYECWGEEATQEEVLSGRRWHQRLMRIFGGVLIFFGVGCLIPSRKSRKKVIKKLP